MQRDNWAVSVVAYLMEVVDLMSRTVRTVPQLRGRSIKVIGRVLLMQVLFSGAHAVLPLTVAAVALGTLVIYQAITYLPFEYVESVSALVLVREVIPLLTAFLLIGRSGTAITIEVGTMKLNDELAALSVMGIRFEHFVVLPRLVGMVVAFVLLQVYGNVAAVVGGYYVTEAIVGHPMSFPVANLMRAVEPSDLTQSMIKVVLFGVVVALTAVQHGLHVEKSRREIPIVTTQAVVRSLLLCFLINTAVSLSA